MCISHGSVFIMVIYDLCYYDYYYCCYNTAGRAHYMCVCVCVRVCIYVCVTIKCHSNTLHIHSLYINNVMVNVYLLFRFIKLKLADYLKDGVYL